MRAIAISLLEESDHDAERILGALSEAGLECCVRRVRTAEALAAVLDDGGVSVVLAGGAPPGMDAGDILDVARAHGPGTPVIVVAREARLEQAAALLAAGAVGYVPRAVLGKLGAAVLGAVDGAAERGRTEAALRFLAEALDAGRRKDELLARVAHELRTPLNAMLGWASMLRTRRLDEAARARALETIERNARAEARLIEDLLDVSRMLTGTLRLEVAEVELCPAVAAVVEASRPAAEAKAVALSAALDDTAGSVLGDPGRLRQAIHELIANALRATPRGGHVGVRLSHAGALAEIAVTDTGRGIRPDLLAHLFEGFPRAGATRHGSLGVGLAIVRHVVEAHGGTIVAESAGEGRGATFTLRLPRLAAEWTERPSRRLDGRDARESRGGPPPSSAQRRV